MGTEEGSAVQSARGEEAGPGAGTRGPATHVELPAPRMLAGRYRLGDRLGRGGMGTVWRAQDEMLDREVAVKELSVGHLAEEDLEIVRSRMKQEARAAARIKHPGVITIHDVLEQDGKPWIVMELIDGRSLAELVEQDGTLNPREAAGIGAQVLAALHRGHQAGVIHRDVKPANVLLERGTGRVVITDFGIATYEGDSALTRTGDLIGSPDYLAPERVHGSRPGPESDLWGLGATLYASVEGQSPFRRESPLTTLAAVVADPLPEPRNAGALAPVLHALMSKDPKERPSAPEAIRMLERIAAGETTNISVQASPLRSPTEAVPLADRNEQPTRQTGQPGGFGHPGQTYQHAAEHEHARTVRSEPIRPTFVEAEYRPTARPVGRSVGPDQGPATTQPSPHQQAPATHGGRRTRRRRTWPWLLVAALVAALAGGAAAYEISKRNARQPSRTTGGAGTPAPPTPANSPQGQTHPGYTPTLPPGYTFLHDPAGFTFPLPPPSEGRTWTNDARDGLIGIDYSPDGGTHLLRFGVTRDPALTPMQHAEEMQQSASANDPSFQSESLVASTFDGFQGVRWTYHYTTKGSSVRHHTVEEMFKDNTGTEYDILVDYPETDMQTGWQRFQDVLNGFSAP